jgi:hypothetical protein
VWVLIGVRVVIRVWSADTVGRSFSNRVNPYIVSFLINLTFRLACLFLLATVVRIHVVIFMSSYQSAKLMKRSYQYPSTVHRAVSLLL